MSSSRKSNLPIEWVIRSIPFVLLLAIGLLGNIGLSQLRRPPERRDNVALAPLVQTTPVASASETLNLEVDGEAIPFREVSLAAQVDGTVIEKSELCRAGQFVKSGDVMMQIDPQDYDLEIERTQKLIQQTEVNIEEVDVERTNTEQLISLAQDDIRLQAREVARMEKLFRQRASSEGEVDAAKRVEIQTRNSLKQLQNQLRLLETRRARFLTDKDRYHVELKQAKVNRARCEITAPIDGIIVSDPIEEDDYVQRGNILLQIEDTTQIEVRFDLKLDQLRWIWNGNRTFDPFTETAMSYSLPNLPVEISVKTEGHRYVWDAELARYDGGGLDPRTRTVPCIALVKNPRSGKPADSESSSLQQHFAPPALLRGMYVKVQIDIPTKLSLLEVPAIALRPGNRVWVTNGDELEMVDVNVAQLSGDRALLFANETIQTGDEVVVSPLALAVKGMKIRKSDSTTAPADTGPTATVAEIDSRDTINGVNGVNHSDEGTDR